MQTESHLIRIDIKQSPDGLFGCQVNNGHGDLLLELAPNYRDRLTAVKTALCCLTENDLSEITQRAV